MKERKIEHNEPNITAGAIDAHIGGGANGVRDAIVDRIAELEIAAADAQKSDTHENKMNQRTKDSPSGTAKPVLQAHGENGEDTGSGVEEMKV